jgi:hypothetical protein
MDQSAGAAVVPVVAPENSSPASGHAPDQTVALAFRRPEGDKIPVAGFNAELFKAPTCRQKIDIG